jgi:hypothetical protein
MPDVSLYKSIKSLTLVLKVKVTGSLKRDKKSEKIIINSLNHQTTKLESNMQDVILYKSITNIDHGSKGQGHGGP